MQTDLKTVRARDLAYQEPMVTDFARATRAADYDDGLLTQAMPIVLLAYTFMFLAAAVTFWESGAALFAIAISVVYIVIYFAVPAVTARVRERLDNRWDAHNAEASADKVQTFTGEVERWEGVFQMTLIPITVSFVFVGFCVIWSLQAP